MIRECNKWFAQCQYLILNLFYFVIIAIDIPVAVTDAKELTLHLHNVLSSLLKSLNCLNKLNYYYTALIRRNQPMPLLEKPFNVACQ